MRLLLGSPQTIEAVQELEEGLERKKRNTIIETMQNEKEMIAQLQDMQEVESHNLDNEVGEQEEYASENPEDLQNNESHAEYRGQGETEGEGQIENSELQYTEDKQNTEQRGTHTTNNEGQQGATSQSGSGQKETRNSHLQGSGSPPRQKGHFYPRYINKREKMQMLMRNPAFVKINQEVSSPVAERKVEIFSMNHKIQDPNFMMEPSPSLPEEKGIKINAETPFIEDFEADNVPRRLKVSMQNQGQSSMTPDIDDSSYPEAWKSKSRLSRASRPDDSHVTKGYPLENTFDEKSFIKKNIDNYQAFEPEEPNFFARDVFAELGVKPGYENDVVLERLKHRYEAAYRDNFLLDKGEMRQNERNKGRSINLPETGFLSEEHFKDKKLLGSLKSPNNANNLGSLDEEFGSESFREYKILNSPGGVYAQLRKGDNVGYSKPNIIPHRGRGSSSERPHIPLFEQFEQEIYEIAATAKERLSVIEGVTELGSALTNKSSYSQRQRSLPQ